MRNEQQWLDLSGLRSDGRRPQELRAMQVRLGDPKPDGVDGVAMLQMGLTSVLAHCVGPKECRRGEEISCNVVTASGRSENAIATTLVRTMEGAVLMQLRTQVVLNLHVLSDGGSLLACCLNAASLALADAGIATRDFVAAATVGLVGKHLFFDLTKDEEFYSGPRITVAILPATKNVLLAQLDGDPISDGDPALLLNRSLDAASLGARQLAGIARDHASHQSTIRETTALIT